MRHRSFLIISAAPDRRASTVSLRALVADLDRRPDSTATLWFLRPHPDAPTTGDTVVDSLRTWAPAALLSQIGLERAAGVLRGLRLRAWLREVAPDVVILDDGLGDRAIEHVSSQPIRVIRQNAEPPAGTEAEPPPATVAALRLVPPGSPHDAGSFEMPLVRDLSSGRRMSGATAKRDVRSALGFPLDVPLVTGWGDDGWVDGAELFVRGLWTLRARHGIEAHGRWLTGRDDPQSIRRFRAEVARCHLDGAVDIVEDAAPDARFCGDLVFLPYRWPSDPLLPALASAAGLPVVTFDVNAIDDPRVTGVADLDLEAAAGEMARLLRDPPPVQPGDQPLDVSAWTDRFLALLPGRPT